MTERIAPNRADRPEFRNINALTDLPTYRLPPAGWVSILHRVSGALMFLLLPFIIWMFDKSISSEISFAKFTAAFNVGLGFVPGWFMKLVALALIWAYLHHLLAGLRHLLMEFHIGITKPKSSDSIVKIWKEVSSQAAGLGGGKMKALCHIATHIFSPNKSALAVLVLSLATTSVIAAKLFALY